MRTDAHNAIKTINCLMTTIHSFITAARLSSYILYIYKHTLCYKIKSLTLLKQIKFTKQTRARTRRQDNIADMVTVGVYD